MRTQQNSIIRIALWLAIVALGIRLVSLGLFPLMDTTEARYGEIARIMAETGNWITPQFDYNIPFWGKPPLYTWITALSFKWFGVGEFTARLPHFLTGLIILGLVWIVAKRQMSHTAAALAVGILSTTAVFLISIGAVMTDTVLLLGMTLTLISFWMAWNHAEQKPGSKGGIWGYLFFIGLAIGLLAKGPLILVLTGLPVFLWCLPQKRILKLWSRLPWITGILLMLAIALPWYLMAEKATPGFLDYFIVGEHFKRFLVSGWQGDLYGTAHVQPKGAIWLQWLYAALPWNIVLPLAWWKARKQNSANRCNGSGSDSEPEQEQSRQWRLFLWCWMLTPMIFFTMAGNILWTYVLPGIPALALLVTDYLKDFIFRKNDSSAEQKTNYRWILAPGAVMPVAMIVLTVLMNTGTKHSAKKLVDAYQAQPDNQQTELLFWNKRPFSGQFYSNGKALEVKGLNGLKDHINEAPASIYLVINSDDKERLPKDINSQMVLIAEGKKEDLWRYSGSDS